MNRLIAKIPFGIFKGHKNSPYPSYAEAHDQRGRPWNSGARITVNFDRIKYDAIGFKILGLSLTEFVDQRVDAEAILNPEIGRTRDQMANAISDLP
jgi:hypothetical protein